MMDGLTQKILLSVPFPGLFPSQGTFMIGPSQLTGTGRNQIAEGCLQELPS